MSDIADSYTNFVVIKKEKKPKREPNKLVVINEEDLIRQVEIRPILYDKSLKGYRKSALRHQYWKEIANCVGSSVEECRKRWRSLRDAFSKHYKLMGRMDAVPTYKRKKWIFYDQMSFIAHYLDNSNLEIEETVLEDLQDNSHDDMMLNDADTGGDMNVTGVTEVTHNSFKTEASMHAALEQQTPDHHQHHQHQTDTTTIDLVDGNQFITRIFPSPTAGTQYLTLDEHDNDGVVAEKKEMPPMKSNTLTPEEYGTLMNIDGDDKFLLSCSPILKRLPRQKNALARLKIQQILYNIEFGGEV